MIAAINLSFIKNITHSLESPKNLDYCYRSYNLSQESELVRERYLDDFQ